jgi:hypothetical protein
MWRPFTLGADVVAAVQDFGGVAIGWPNGLFENRY